MPGNVKRLDTFGRRVRQAQDEALLGPCGDDALREARTLWLSSPSESKGARPTDGRPWVGAISALVAAACVLLLAGTRRAAPLTFQVGPSERPRAPATGSATPGVPGQWVAAPNAERIPLHFSDGSVVRLEPSARARVVDVTDTGGRVALESGTVHAESSIARGRDRSSTRGRSRSASRGRGSTSRGTRPTASSPWPCSKGASRCRGAISRILAW